MPPQFATQLRSLHHDWRGETEAIMTDGWAIAQKGGMTPPWYQYTARRANRSKRKAIYFVAGPAIAIGVSAAAGVFGVGVAVGVIASALVGYAAYKGWRNARQEYSRRTGMKTFRLELDRVKGLHVGPKANISADVVNRVRFFIQKGSLGKLTDDFNYLVDRQMKLLVQFQAPLRNCRDGIELANLLYAMDRRRDGLMIAADDFRLFYLWIINEMERCRDLLSSDNLKQIMRQIDAQASNRSPNAHRKCGSCCYRLVNGKVSNPAVSTLRFSNANWKHAPFPRLMNDAMVMAFIGLDKSTVAYGDYQQELRRLFEGIININANDISDLPRVDTPSPGTDRAKKMAKGFAQGAGRAGGVGETIAGAKGVTYALHVPLTQVTGALLPQTAVQVGTGMGFSAVSAVGGAAVRTIGELINTSIELSRLKIALEPTGAWHMLTEKSSRLDSLRAILKGGAFETGIDHFIKLRKRVEELEKIIGPDANVRIDDCRTAVAVAFNALNAIKHWQEMTGPMHFVKEYAEILEAQVTLHQHFQEDQWLVMNRVENMVNRHAEDHNGKPCWKYCKCVPVDAD